jgi:hypothetical protein
LPSGYNPPPFGPDGRDIVGVETNSGKPSKGEFESGLTDILYQSDRESITRRAARNEIEVPLRLHIGIFRPAGGGVQAERSEFIDRAWTPLSVGLMDTGAGEGRLNECSG